MNCEIVPSNQNKAATQNGCATAQAHTVRPQWGVKENGEGWTLRVVIPGVSKDQLQLNVEHNRLNIRGVRQAEPAEGWMTLHRESRGGDYELVLDLNERVDTEQIKARLEQGILYVEVPKREEAKPRRIEIA